MTIETTESAGQSTLMSRASQNAVPTGRKGDPFATKGALEVRLASDEAELTASQELRFHVFYEEMSAVPSAEVGAARRDFDEFDPICDHLVVLDHAAPKRPDGGAAIVGTYRLLRREVAEAHDGFYTSREFDMEPLFSRKPPETRFLELGRSCTQIEYRTKPVIELLWHGIMSYVALYDMDVMFGCASLEGTNPEKIALPLSFLHYEYGAPEDWTARARDEQFVPMDLLAKEDVNVRNAVRALPPLIKGYIRAGAYIGDGAVIDHQFNTTDVLIIFPVRQMNGRYYSRFGKAERDG